MRQVSWKECPEYEGCMRFYEILICVSSKLATDARWGKGHQTTGGVEPCGSMVRYLAFDYFSMPKARGQRRRTYRGRSPIFILPSSTYKHFSSFAVFNTSSHYNNPPAHSRIKLPGRLHLKVGICVSQVSKVPKRIWCNIYLEGKYW